MTATQLEIYNFHEYETGSYEEVRERFEWFIPESVNVAEYVCDRHATGPSTPGIIYEDSRGREGSYTFQEMEAATNKLANHLVRRGVTRGDRVAVCAPQKPETALAHIAIWKIGAVSVPLSVLFGPDALEYRLNDCDASVLFADGVNIDSIRATKSKVGVENTILIGDVAAEADESRFSDALSAGEATFDVVETNPEDEMIVLKSRTDDVIISSGYRIGPEEIEDTVAQHDVVADVGVIGVPDEERGSITKAFVRLTDGPSPSEETRTDIQSFVKDRLSKYEYPRRIEFVDELPKTVTGKIRRAELREAHPQRTPER